MKIKQGIYKKSFILKFSEKGRKSAKALLRVFSSYQRIAVAAVAISLLWMAAAAQAQFQEKQVKVFGVKINYIEAGDASRPKVILLHGLGGNGGNWQPVIQALAGKYHVFAPDQVGFGKSEKPIIKYRVATFVDFLDKFMAELKIEKAAVVGHSMGGWIAALAAVKYPSRISRLVLTDSAGIMPKEPVNAEEIYKLNYSTRDEVRELFKKLLYNPQPFLSDTAVDAAMERMMTAGDSYTIQSLIESVLRDKEDFLNGKLPGIKCPTLIIWGEADGLTKPSDGEELNKGIKGSELVIIKKAGHSPQLEQPIEYNKVLLEFLQKTD
jgi:pimeloyl-ACP methyl ester carboxylesterase